jgi:YD repeat-containing protein
MTPHENLINDIRVIHPEWELTTVKYTKNENIQAIVTTDQGRLCVTVLLDEKIIMHDPIFARDLAITEIQDQVAKRTMK